MGKNTKELKQQIKKLSKMVLDRTGQEELNDWQIEMIHAAASLKCIMEKQWEELMDGEMTTIEVGVKGQQKTVINPLLTTYNQMHRSYMDDLTALALNYNTTPSKVVENTKTGYDEQDPMQRFFAEKENVK